MRYITPLALVAALSVGCAAARLGPLDPQPRVLADQQDAYLALTIGEEVPDRFTVTSEGGVRDVRVKRWHETLTRGFENGLASVYALLPPDGEPDLLLELVSAELTFHPAPGSAAEGATPAEAELTYRARVLDAAGTELAASAGELKSRRTWSTNEEMVEAVEEVVIAMIEEIAYVLVTKTSAGAPEPEEDPAPEVEEPAPPEEPTAPDSP
jgi:hypothetical protein